MPNPKGLSYAPGLVLYIWTCDLQVEMGLWPPLSLRISFRLKKINKPIYVGTSEYKVIPSPAKILDFCASHWVSG